MTFYLATSTVILGWVFLLAALWAVFCFLRQCRRPVDSWAGYLATLPLPAVVLAPLAVYSGHRWLGIDLLFPPAIIATIGDVIVTAFLPGLILVIASGLGQQIAAGIHLEWRMWARQPFVQAAVSRGASRTRHLGAVIVGRCYWQAIAASATVLFGELIVIEALFGAPGIGSAAWGHARSHDARALAGDLTQLILLYAGCRGAAIALTRRLGRRLAGYC